MKNIILFTLVFFKCALIYAQKSNDFNVYLQKSRYNNETIIKLNKEISVYNYYFIGAYYIDRKHEGIINLTTLKDGLDKIVPDKLDSGYLCLDIENDIYKSLKFNKNKKKGEESIDKLIEMVQYVKKERPNLQVTIYGIPFTFYWEKVYYQRFDRLIKELDFISPHLYIYYPSKQVGEKANIDYLEKNLEVFLDYGKRLNKPVLPFFWYRVHPSNKKFGKEILQEKEIMKYLSFIKYFSYNSLKVSGVLWWEPMNKDKIDINSQILKSFINDSSHNK